MKKFTLFIMMLVMCATTTFAQTAIESPEDIQSGKIYWFDNVMNQTNGWGTLIYVNHENPNYSNKLWATCVWQDSNGNGIEATPEDSAQLFSFIKYEDKFYLYSVGAETFVSWKEDGAWITDIPTSFVTVDANTFGNPDFPWNIKFDGEKFIGLFYQGGYEYSGYLYCTGSNPANQIYAWQIFEVGELENTAALETALAEQMVIGAQQREKALDALYEAMYDAEDLLTNINYSCSGGEQIVLQVSDDNAGNYIWCNEPEFSEGPIEGLIDGDVNTFFHSRWSAGGVEPVHWLQVDLETPIKDFKFAYHTRVFDGVNDFPDAIEVQGSNDGYEFTKIANFDSKLPQTANTRWESTTIEADKEYAFLRFVVTAERTYFHMSEFYLYSALNISADEAYLPYKEYLKQLEDLKNAAQEMTGDESAKTADIEAMTAQLIELCNLINNLVSEADDPLTIEYIDVVKELLAREGVGYPAEAPRAALQAVLDKAIAKPTAQARLDLEAAVDDYYVTEDIILPVDGVKYTLTFLTYGGRRNFLKYQDFLLSMEHDTLTTQGMSLPVEAAFTCVDNGNGTFDFKTADDRYLATPPNNALGEGTESGVADYKSNFTIVKMYPNGKCETDVTYETLFGLVALSNGGTYMAPNSSGTAFYQGSLPHFMGSWTSAMVIEEYVAEDGTGIKVVAGEKAPVGIYDLQGRKIENVTEAGIYIVNGKKVLVK